MSNIRKRGSLREPARKARRGECKAFRRDVRDGRSGEKRRCMGHGEEGETGEKSEKGEEPFQLREPRVSYPLDLGPKNDDIEAENGYFWNDDIYISIGPFGLIVMVLNGGADEGTHLNDSVHHSEFFIFTCRTLAKTLGASQSRKL